MLGPARRLIAAACQDCSRDTAANTSRSPNRPAPFAAELTLVRSDSIDEVHRIVLAAASQPLQQPSLTTVLLC